LQLPLHLSARGLLSAVGIWGRLSSCLSGIRRRRYGYNSRREERHDFIQYVLQEGEYAVVAGAKDVLENAEAVLDMIGAAGAAQPGVGRQCGGRVAGQLDLGDDGDIAVGGIFDDVPDLVLGIVTAVFDAVIARAGIDGR
jgi:hypothetical protein